MFTVLYVDDDSALLDLARIFLEMSGKIRIETAQSVGEAIALTERNQYDGIISDYEMPQVDGIRFLRYIRQHQRDLPFILFTGRSREEIAIEALNNGADFYFQKGGNPKSQFAELEYNLLNALDRKRARDDLKESRQLMANLIDFLPDATFAINKENQVISWNLMMETMTGVHAASIMGTDKYPEVLSRFNGKRIPLVDIVLDPAKDVTGLNLTRKGKTIISEFYSPMVYEGKGAHLWLIASPLYNSGGNAIGAIESIRDISQSRVAEENLQSAHGELNAAYEQLAAADEELRQNYQELAKSQQEIQKNEDRYRRIVEDQTEFICRFLPDGKLSFVNGAYCRYFSLDPATSIGRPHTVKIPREDQVLMKQHLAELSPEHPVAAIEHRIVMPDGEVRWQRWSDRAICDKEGRITEYQSVGQDITEQYEALEHLRSTNMELNAAYEQLAATEEELRQNYEELAKSQRDLHESEDRYRHIVEDQTEFISRFLPGGEHIFVNDAYCRYFGKSREEIVGHRFVPAIPGEDRPVLAAHFRAITPENPVHTIEHRIIMPDGEVRWQQWSDRAIFNGSGKVREYQSVGRDITDRKRTELALSEANKKLNLLTSITRHDILNQLTGLQGCLELIEAKSTDPVITMLVQRATRAGKVIDGQIVFTRQYENIGVKNPVWLEVSEVVKRVSQAGGFRMVRIDPSLEGLEIFTDPLLKLVFYNLFENAVVHGGTITKIEVGGIVTGDGTDIVVADDGKGILPSEKERIFEKGVGSHTGLGLYLVREILSITRMTISETGESGRGARFVIHVPAGMFRTSAQ